jgi:hypothetical protein
MFREATTAEIGTNQHTKGNNNIITQPKQGTSRAYTLDRLHREAPELYQRVVDKELSANQAAIEAGFRKVKTPVEQLQPLEAPSLPTILRLGGLSGLPLHVRGMIQAASLQGPAVINHVASAGSGCPASRWAGMGSPELLAGILACESRAQYVQRLAASAVV